MADNYIVGSSVSYIRVSKEKAAEIESILKEDELDSEPLGFEVDQLKDDDGSILISFYFDDNINEGDCYAIQRVVDIVGDQKHAIAFATYCSKNRMGESSGWCWLFTPGGDMAVHDVYDIAMNFLNSEVTE